MKVLGISCYYHDSATAIVDEKEIKFAIQEERLSRKKHDSSFPINAINYALINTGINVNDLSVIAFYELPKLKLNRLCDMCVWWWPKSWKLFIDALPSFYHNKYNIENEIRRILRYKGEIKSYSHHLSHAASAFYTSKFEEALILTMDGVGEYDTLVVYKGEGNKIKRIKAIQFPNSLGLLYSVFTAYLGFEVNEGEYKVMGLAPYGKPKYVKLILDNLIQLHQDGSFSLNLYYFPFWKIDTHFDKKLEKLIKIPPRRPGDEIKEWHCDLANSIQRVLELAIINVLKSCGKFDYLCLAGGVALNCTANAKILENFNVKSIHIQPAATDAGGALGCAFLPIVEKEKNTIRWDCKVYLGKEFNEKEIESTLKILNINYFIPNDVIKYTANKLVEGKVVGWFQGRDEWGPRALGNRSILADPRLPEMKDYVNKKIKFREEFRPFAPVVLEEEWKDWFEYLSLNTSPYMLFNVKCKKCDKIPAVVHVDGTSRIQTVNEKQNPRYYALIKEFYKLTGVPVLLNTSFNLKGEPIVSSPSDAINTFYKSGIDILVLDKFVIEK